MSLFLLIYFSYRSFTRGVRRIPSRILPHYPQRSGSQACYPQQPRAVGTTCERKFLNWAASFNNEKVSGHPIAEINASSRRLLEL
jgi:hypothetical protein